MLGIHERRVTQALEPALQKIARLMLADPLKTTQALGEAMEEIRAEADLARRRQEEEEHRRYVDRVEGSTSSESTASSAGSKPRTISTRGAR